MCGRNPDEFIAGRTLPTGGELARYLATVLNYPPGARVDLARVAQYVYPENSGTLFEALANLFRPQYEPTDFHKLLASQIHRLRLIVTTNYDDLMERAIDQRNAQLPSEERVAYDVVWYESEGPDAGLFRHWRQGQTTDTIPIIRQPAEYADFNLRARPVILKIHGAIDRYAPDPERAMDSFVIAEDQYFDYLERLSAGRFLPKLLGAEIQACPILFVGYGLSDWNMRVLLRQLWRDRRLGWESWSLQRVQDIDPGEEKLWEGRNVQLIGGKIEAFTVRMRELLE